MSLNGDIIQEEHAELLLQDDITGWIKLNHGYTSVDLMHWVEEHAPYVVQHCPRIMSLAPIRHEVFAQRIAAQWEEWTDEQKLALLDGVCHNKMQTMLHEFMRDRPNGLGYKVLSPSWIGAPGSALRQKAQELGWTSDVLASQIVVGLELEENAPAAWRSWIAYPHGMLALFQGDDTENSYDAEASPDLSEQQTKPWDNPKDILIAQMLRALLPSKRNETLVVHPDVDLASICPQDRFRLQSLVEVHMGLGALNLLHEKMLANDPFVEPTLDERLVLPDLNAGPTHS